MSYFLLLLVVNSDEVGLFHRMSGICAFVGQFQQFVDCPDISVTFLVCRATYDKVEFTVIYHGLSYLNYPYCDKLDYSVLFHGIYLISYYIRTFPLLRIKSGHVGIYPHMSTISHYLRFKVHAVTKGPIGWYWGKYQYLS